MGAYENALYISGTREDLIAQCERHRLEKAAAQQALRIAKMAIEQGASLACRAAANGPTVGDAIERGLNPTKEDTTNGYTT